MSRDIRVVPHPKKRGEPIEVFYVARQSHTLYVPVVGEDGKAIQETNQVTGLPLLDKFGLPRKVERSISFRPHQMKFAECGYWCKYVCRTDTKDPGEILVLEALRKAAASRFSEVMNEKTFLEITNPPLAAQYDELEKVSKEAESLKSEKAKADEEISNLKKQLAQNQNRR